jgi:HNH endonuclease
VAIDHALAEAVRVRAGYVCEYCRMPMTCYPTVVFPIDHIIARQHGGPTILSNLALSCLNCHAFKGPNIAEIDPVTKKLFKLFNPRRHKWAKHFSWNCPLNIGRTAIGRVTELENWWPSSSKTLIMGRTAIGRVTVMVLAMNDSEAVEVRAELIEEGKFPPKNDEALA